MEPTQAKPVKKRRRWLIVALVLVPVSLCSWWYWPRGDARFVGKWSGKPVGATYTGEWKLHWNGTGRTKTPYGPGGDFSWRVEGNRFVIGRNSIVTGTIVGQWIERGSVRLTGRIWLMRQMDFEIVSMSERTIRLKAIPNGHLIDLERESE